MLLNLASFLTFIEDCYFCHPSLRPIIVAIHRAKICKSHFFISEQQTGHIEKGALLTTLLCRNENGKGISWQGVGTPSLPSRDFAPATTVLALPLPELSCSALTRRQKWQLVGANSKQQVGRVELGGVGCTLLH